MATLSDLEDLVTNWLESHDLKKGACCEAFLSADPGSCWLWSCQIKNKQTQTRSVEWQFVGCSATASDFLCNPFPPILPFSARIYSKLPEVKKKREAEKKRVVSQTNRLRVGVFKKVDIKSVFGLYPPERITRGPVPSHH